MNVKVIDVRGRINLEAAEKLYCVLLYVIKEDDCYPIFQGLMSKETDFYFWRSRSFKMTVLYQELHVLTVKPDSFTSRDSKFGFGFSLWMRLRLCCPIFPPYLYKSL